jgi:hypothetical protein
LRLRKSSPEGFVKFFAAFGLHIGQPIGNGQYFADSRVPYRRWRTQGVRRLFWKFKTPMP